MVDQILLAASTVAASTLTTDRAVATASAVLALAGVILGSFALTGSATPGVRRRALLAVGAGVVATIAGTALLATADGGPGTGNGVVGAYAGVVLGVLAAILGGSALRRSRSAIPIKKI